MKLFVASLATETNTFSPVFTDLRDFRNNFYFPPGTHPDIPSLCSSPFIAARELKQREGNAVTVIEGTAAWAEPGGIVSRAAYLHLRNEILEQLAGALPVDGVLLGLHGAMVAQDFDDCEGDLMHEIRKIVGKKAIIGATFDPHSHFTRRCAQANVAITFKEFPHTDMAARARELVDIVARAARGQIKPVISMFDCKMIDVFPTTEQAIRDFVDRTIALEDSRSHILSISIVHGFLAGDVPEMGTKIVVVTDDAKAEGDALARELGLELYAMRGTTRMRLLTPTQALDMIRPNAGRGPAIIADVWDNPGGGMAGDSTMIVREIMRRKINAVAIASIWDPIAVQFCFAAGFGAKIPLRFGAKSGHGLGEPIDAIVEVAGLSERGTMHFGGSSAQLGRCAAVRLDNDLEVVLAENRVQCYTPDFFKCVDIDPTKKRLLVVKSTNHFRAEFSELSDQFLYVDSGVPYPHNPCKTNYRKLDRDIWPIVSNPVHDF